MLGLDGQGLAVDLGVFVDPFLGALLRRKANDHAMHGGFAAGLVAPFEGLVGKVGVHALGAHPTPEHPDLLALHDAIGGHIAHPQGMVEPRIVGPFDVPGRHKIEHAAAFQAVEERCHISLLLRILVLLAYERRIAQHIAAALGRQHLVPVDAQRVAMHHMRAAFERDAREVQAKLFAHAQVHLVIDQPQGDLGDLRREFFDFYAKELIDVQADELVHVQGLLAVTVAGAQHFQFEQA